MSRTGPEDWPLEYASDMTDFVEGREACVANATDHLRYPEC